MKKSDDVITYGYDWAIKNVLKKIKKELSKTNQKLIKKYHQEMIIQSLAKSTQLKQLQTILQLSRMLKKDWKDVKKSDIDKIALKISQRFGDELGKETFYSYDHKKILRIFFRWMKLGSRSYPKVGDPPETRGIKTQIVFNKIARKDLITQKDRQKLLEACAGNLRDRALIDCHLEAGTRPSEILNLRIHHIQFDELGAILKVNGKTGTRIIRIIKSVPSLASWISVHPFKDDYDAPLWINLRNQTFGTPLSYPSARAMIKRRAKKAGIKKKINLHLFRHSSATDAANYLTDAQMRERYGWSSYSRVPGRYVHLSHKDIDKAMMKHYGILKQKKKKVRIECRVCGNYNLPENDICYRCGKALSFNAIAREEKQRHILEDISRELKIPVILE